MSRVVEYDQFGGPEVLRLREREAGEPAPGWVRVRVRAVGLNPFDAKARSGTIPFIAPDFPRGLGGDFAGVVDAVAANEVFAIGDEVLGWADSGALADQVIVPIDALTIKPPSVSWEVAASLSTPAQTAHHCLEVLDIGAHDTVLVSAAAGAVGMVYAQRAIARGAIVIGTASPANASRLRSIGVIPTPYGAGLADRVRALAPQGITAVQDNAGHETVSVGLELGLAPNRICTIVDHAAVAELGLASPGRYAKSAALLAEYAALVAQGALRIDIEARYPLAQVSDAFVALETGHRSGKIVVIP